MLIAAFESGPVATLGYLVADHENGRAVMIDAPEGVTDRVIRKLQEWKCALDILVNTHGHWDHILDNAELLRRTGARLAIHRDSAPLLTMPQLRYFGIDGEIAPSQPDLFLEEGRPLEVGTLSFNVLHCPGHCPGSVVLYEPQEKVAFVGDVVFAGSVGRTDLPGGDHDQLMDSIRTRLFPLEDSVRFYPGHGPATTLGRERRSNPFLTRMAGSDHPKTL